MTVDAISFSAHADYAQTSQFLAALAPPHVVLVRRRTRAGAASSASVTGVRAWPCGAAGAGAVRKVARHAGVEGEHGAVKRAHACRPGLAAHAGPRVLRLQRSCTSAHGLKGGTRYEWRPSRPAQLECGLASRAGCAGPGARRGGGDGPAAQGAGAAGGRAGAAAAAVHAARGPAGAHHAPGAVPGQGARAPPPGCRRRARRAGRRAGA